MRKQIYAGIGGFIAGALAAFFIANSGGRESDGEIEKVRQQLALAESENVDLQSRLKNLPKPSATVSIGNSFLSQSSDDETADEDATYRDKMTQRRAESLKQKLEIFAFRTGVSPELFAGIRQQLDERSQAANGLPPLSWKEIEAQLMPQLSPEQRLLAEQLKEEQRTAALEMSVHSELFRLQSTLGLTEQQKERVFDALVEIRSQSAERRYSNPQSAALAEQELRRKAFTDVLSNEQMRVFDANRKSAAALGNQIRVSP